MQPKPPAAVVKVGPRPARVRRCGDAGFLGHRAALEGADVALERRASRAACPRLIVALGLSLAEARVGSGDSPLEAASDGQGAALTTLELKVAPRVARARRFALRERGSWAGRDALEAEEAAGVHESDEGFGADAAGGLTPERTPQQSIQ